MEVTLRKSLVLEIKKTQTKKTLKNNINNLTQTSRRNLFPSNVVENVERKFLDNNFTPGSSQSAARKDNCLYIKLLQEKMRGQRGRLPVQPLGYVMSTKVIFRRAEVCLTRRLHAGQPRSDL